MLAHEDYRRALDAARLFVSVGLVPLPSRMGRKQPMLDSYKEYRTKQVERSVYSEETWRTTNIQLMTGV